MSLYGDMAGTARSVEVLDDGEALLIDAAVLANAVYYAERSRSRREDGPAATDDPQPAVTGPKLRDFAASILDRFQPTHALAAWDGRRSWRKAPPEQGGITGYKSSRQPKPYGLRALLRVAPQVFASLGVESVSVDSQEADDVIASAAARSRCVIVSNDKDFAQLLGYPRVRWWNPLAAPKGEDGVPVERGEWITRETVNHRWGVEPWQFPHYQALAGDSADSVPGCPGIGAVGASNLIWQFHTIDRLFEVLDSTAVWPALEPYAAKLRAGRESVLESLRAVTLSTSLDVTAPPVGPRQELDQDMFTNPFKKPPAPGAATVTEQLSAQTRVEAQEESAVDVPEAQDAPEEPAAETPKGPPLPKRGRPVHQLPDHPAIPEEWRGRRKSELRLALVGQCRMALAKAAREAGHDVPLSTPETRHGALLEEISALVETLTGARPWPADTAPEVEPEQAPETEPSDEVKAGRARCMSQVNESVRNAVACRQSEETVRGRARACRDAFRPEYRIDDAALEAVVSSVLASAPKQPPAIDREQAPEGHRPMRAGPPAPKGQAVELEPQKEPEPQKEHPAATLYIDCQPLDGHAIELDAWAEPFAAEVCAAKNVEHVLLCPYSEGPKLVATRVARHIRAGEPVPSLVVRRSSPLADACLPELRRAFSRAQIIEATR